MRLFPFYLKTHYADNQYHVWPTTCPECGYDTFYLAIKRRTYLHVFWLPLIPLPAKFVLYCGECGSNIEVLRDEFKDAKKLHRDYMDFRRGEMPAVQYAEHLDRWHEDTGLTLPRRLVPADATDRVDDDTDPPDDRAFQ